MPMMRDRIRAAWLALRGYSAVPDARASTWAVAQRSKQLSGSVSRACRQRLGQCGLEGTLMRATGPRLTFKETDVSP